MTDITRKRGDTYADKFIIVSDEGGVVVDITGHTFLLTVDPSEAPTGSGANIFQLTGTITDATAGEVEFAPSVSQADNVGNYFYDLEMTDGSSKIRTIDEGRYTMRQDITK